MSLLLNFLGQPGSGKSSLSTMIFSELKARGYEAELVQEFAKTYPKSSSNILLHLNNFNKVAIPTVNIGMIIPVIIIELAKNP